MPMRLWTTDQPATISDLPFGTRLALALLPILCSVIVWIFDTAANMVEKPIVTAEQHIQNIETIVQEKYIEGNASTPYTGFTVEILHDLFTCGRPTDAVLPRYYLVEFEPAGYIYGIIDGEEYYTHTDWRRHQLHNGKSHFAEQNIEPGNRYIALLWGDVYVMATAEDEKLYDIFSHKELDDAFCIDIARCAYFVFDAQPNVNNMKFSKL